jgi:5'-nucleotidase
LRILISNDDGIYAPGLRALAKHLSSDPANEVYVVAPDRERSATGHALTLHKPLRVDEVALEGNVKGAWSTTGTPSDCVKFAVIALLDKTPPDIIVSGINSGANLGNDVLYSGTVSAAMEGAFLNIPSIAVSSVSRQLEGFETAAQFMTSFVKILPTAELPPATLLNINVPKLPLHEIKGVCITKLGYRIYNDSFEKRVDPHGKNYYWLAGHAVQESKEENTDTWAIANEYISVTPIAFDMTDHKSLEKLRRWQEPMKIAGLAPVK